MKKLKLNKQIRSELHFDGEIKIEQRRARDGEDLRVLDVSILPDFSGDGGAKLRDSGDVVEIVDLHDCGERSTSLLEQVEDSLPSFL